LSTFSAIAKAASSYQRRAEITVLAAQHFTNVDADSHLEHGVTGRSAGRLLHSYGAAYRVSCGRKRSEHAVAEPLQLLSAGGLYRFCHQMVVGSKETSAKFITGALQMRG
jgi:hypothetical protein